MGPFCSILMTALQYQSNPICCKYPFIRQSQIMSHLALIFCCFSLKLFPLNSLKTQDEREIIFKRKIVGGCGNNYVFVAQIILSRNFHFGGVRVL